MLQSILIASMAAYAWLEILIIHQSVEASLRRSHTPRTVSPGPEETDQRVTKSVCDELLMATRYNSTTKGFKKRNYKHNKDILGQKTMNWVKAIALKCFVTYPLSQLREWLNLVSKPLLRRMAHINDEKEVWNLEKNAMDAAHLDRIDKLE